MVEAVAEVKVIVERKTTKAKVKDKGKVLGISCPLNLAPVISDLSSLSSSWLPTPDLLFLLSLMVEAVAEVKVIVERKTTKAKVKDKVKVETKTTIQIRIQMRHQTVHTEKMKKIKVLSLLVVTLA